MANIKSAKKRVLVNAKKSVRNNNYSASMKTAIKKYKSALEAGDKELANATYKEAVKKIDMAVSKGILHQNTAARRKSQFTLALNSMK